MLKNSKDSEQYIEDEFYIFNNESDKCAFRITFTNIFREI